MESHREIEDRAAAFLAKRDGGDWSDEDQANLTEWMESSTAHRVALLRLEAVWEEARRLRALSAGLTPGNVPPPGEWQHSPFFDSRQQDIAPGMKGTDCFLTSLEPSEVPLPARRENEEGSSAGERRERASRSGRVRFIAFAATILLLAAGIGSYLKFTLSGDPYSTPIGGVASVPLQDGSNITLNTGSKVRVDLDQEERRINLEQGEAFFEVAKDPKRPFIVQAGNKRVIAVGTQFSVRRQGDDVQIVVTEGAVRFETSGSSRFQVKEPSRSANRSVSSEEGSATPQFPRLTAGTIALARDEDLLVQDTSVAKAEEILSWRQGYLTFHETTLSDAVDEFNRYNTHKITIEDSKVAALRISGTFRPTNYEAFLRLLEDGFSIHGQSSGDKTTLTRD